MATRRFLFAWRWALSSEWGPRNPTDRHVALVLSLYMRSDGLGAWPSQTTLAARTGMALRTVRPALQRLVKTGWLSRVTRKPRRGRAAKGLGFDYSARLPKAISAMYWNPNEATVALFRGRDPWKPKRARARRTNGANRDTQMGQPLPPNSVGELVKGDAYKKSLEVSPQEIAEYEAAFNAGGAPAINGGRP